MPHKRDTRAAIGWVGTIWFAPVVGTFLYVWLGINLEFNVECYERTDDVAHRSGRAKIEESRPVSLADGDGRSLPIRLRDGVARPFSPDL